MVERVTSPLEIELMHVLNKYSAENGSNTPDFILAQFLLSCLTTLDIAVVARDRWYGRTLDPLSGTLDALEAPAGPGAAGGQG